MDLLNDVNSGKWVKEQKMKYYKDNKVESETLQKHRRFIVENHWNDVEKKSLANCKSLIILNKTLQPIGIYQPLSKVLYDAKSRQDRMGRDCQNILYDIHWAQLELDFPIVFISTKDG